LNTTLPAPPASASAQRPPARRSRRWTDQLTVYLPVFLMGLLALASYWLLRATPPPPEPAVAQPVGSEPDYFMRGFSVKVFDANGMLINEVFGREARHRPDTDMLEVDQARIRVVGEDGVITTATARQVISNGARTEFLLEGDAVVVREGQTLANGSPTPKLEFRGEQLRVFTDPQRLVSEQPVTVLRGNDKLQSDTLDYVGADQVALMRGRVKVRLSPPQPPR
jgi:lipopolysaccharide export system protein LptC